MLDDTESRPLIIYFYTTAAMIEGGMAWDYGAMSNLV